LPERAAARHALLRTVSRTSLRRGTCPIVGAAVTFTNKAAREMRERVDALLEDVPLDSAPNLSTFHLLRRMLRRDGTRWRVFDRGSPAALVSTTTKINW
jgi:superfamily I DNA/RNA helicase